MPIQIIDTLSVCPDCACYIANADDSALDLYDNADETRATRDHAIASHTMKGHQLVYGDQTDTFSWSHCELCNALPGARHSVTILSR